LKAGIFEGNIIVHMPIHPGNTYNLNPMLKPTPMPNDSMGTPSLFQLPVLGQENILFNNSYPASIWCKKKCCKKYKEKGKKRCKKCPEKN